MEAAERERNELLARVAELEGELDKERHLKCLACEEGQRRADECEYVDDYERMADRERTVSSYCDDPECWCVTARPAPPPAPRCLGSTCDHYQVDTGEFHHPDCPARSR